MATIYIPDQKKQYKTMREFAIEKFGLETIAPMTDKEVKAEMEEKGYQTFVEFNGSGDECDYYDPMTILLAKNDDIRQLVIDGKATYLVAK